MEPLAGGTPAAEDVHTATDAPPTLSGTPPAVPALQVSQVDESQQDAAAPPVPPPVAGGVSSDAHHATGSRWKSTRFLVKGVNVFHHRAEVPLGSKAKAMLAVCGTACGRAGFLAGFAYYELSRQFGERVERVKPYPILLLGTFTLSVACCTLGAFVQMYSRKVHSDDMDKLADRFWPTRAGPCSFGIARVCYRLFVMAFYMYIIALSYMVSVYNPGLDDETAGHIEHLITNWYLYAIVIFAVLVNAYFGLLVNRSNAGESLDLHLDKAIDSAKQTVFGTEREPSIAAEVETELEAQPKPEVDPMVDNEVEEVHADKIVELCNVIGGRSLLMTGFVQHALARYTYIPGGSDADTESLMLNRIFWLATHAACGCLMICVLLTTEISIAVQQLHTQPSRLAFVEQTRWLWRFCQYAKTVGMHCLFLSAGLMGWGCSQRCDDPLVPGGVCYSRLSSAPVVCCGIGLLMVIYFRSTTHVAFVHANRVAQDIADSQDKEPDKTAKADEQADLQHAAGSMTAVNLIGNSATICAGFVTYNIATYDTDVLHGPITGPSNFGLTMWGSIFLWANWASFALGMACALSVLHIDERYRILPDNGAKVAFVDAIPSRAPGFCLVVAMHAFMVAFALFGLAKMSPMRVEPVVIVLAALIGIWTEFSQIHKHYKAAKGVPDTQLPVEIHRWVDHKGGFKTETVVDRTLSQLQSYAPRALLFGGFAYNAVSFMFRPASDMAPTYMMGMSICFCAAMYLTLIDTVVNTLLALLSTEARKEAFCMALRPTLSRAYKLSTVHLVFFLGSFVVMGYIKLWVYDWRFTGEDHQQEYSKQYGWLQLVGGLIALAAFLVQMVNITGTAQRVHDAAISVSVVYKWRELVTDVNIRADSTAFACGNVFYEILFSAVSLDSEGANYAYFGLSVMTLVLGAVSISTATQISYWINDMPHSKRSQFAVLALGHQSLLSGLYIGSQYFWLGSMFFSSRVKYPQSMWWPSAYWAAAGIAIISFGWISAARITAAHRSWDLTVDKSADKEAIAEGQPPLELQPDEEIALEPGAVNKALVARLENIKASCEEGLSDLRRPQQAQLTSLNASTSVQP